MKVNRLYQGKDIRTMNRKELLAIVEDFLNMFTVQIDYSLQPEEFKPTETIATFGTPDEVSGQSLSDAGILEVKA